MASTGPPRKRWRPGAGLSTDRMGPAQTTCRYRLAAAGAARDPPPLPTHERVKYATSRRVIQVTRIAFYSNCTRTCICTGASLFGRCFSRSGGAVKMAVSCRDRSGDTRRHGPRCNGSRGSAGSVSQGRISGAWGGTSLQGDDCPGPPFLRVSVSYRRRVNLDVPQFKARRRSVTAMPERDSSLICVRRLRGLGLHVRRCCVGTAR